MTLSHLRALATAGMLLAGSLVAVVAHAPAAHAEVICDPFASRPIQNGRYIVQNNRWGASTPQCIDVTAGNTSAASPGRTVTTAPGGGGGAAACTATYRTVNAWSGGFQGEVTVRNTGTATLTGWTGTWTLPGGTAITQVWNGRPTFSGSTVSVRNETYNGNVTPGATTSFGFTGTGSSAAPATVACTSP